MQSWRNLLTLVLFPSYGSGFLRPSSLSLGCSVIFGGSIGSSGFGGGGSTVIPNKLRSEAVALTGSLGPKTVWSKYSAVTPVASSKRFEGTLLVVGSVLVRGSEELDGSSVGLWMSVNNPGHLGAVLSVCWYFQRRLFACLTLVLPTVIHSFLGQGFGVKFGVSGIGH